ncbi:HAD family hydrolase [Deinococcus roseus]|uniref:Haloacid dehalogenase n=1 Tax=Deinococcus roseus TaxID=392414 RepID=A0ABQ2D4N3_9DEIO|nr:HAD family hydrolase [Deinococcus roseus]GGJ46073.1 haloacid dehalogenase [Deinococcus roseus]
MAPLLIFDCDGVLVDSEILSNRAGVEQLSELGLQISLEEHIDKFVGRSAADVEKELTALLGRLLPENYSQLKIQRTAEIFEQELQAIAGIDQALQNLPGAKCVASGSHLTRIQQSLQLTGLTEFFQHIFSIDQVKHGKPAPDLFLLAAETLGYRPENCLVIEDSITGVQAAVAAGMPVLGFTGGGHCSKNHAQNLLDVGAKLVFHDMRLLPEMVPQR